MKTINIDEMKQSSYKQMKDSLKTISEEYRIKKENMDKISFLNGLNLPDDCSLWTGLLGYRYLSYATIKCNSFEQLHDIRTQLRKMMPNYSDKVEGIAPYGTKLACVEYATSHPMVRLEVIVEPDKVPQSLFPSDECGFHYEDSKRLVFSCTGKKAM